MREIRQIAEDKPGSMWFASALDGITHISGNDPVTFTTKNGLLSNNSLSIQSLGPDTVIAATIKPGGIYRIINNTIDRTWSKGLEDVTVENIFVDSKKRIWAKTDNSGVILIEKDKLMHLKTKKENNLVDPNIEKITEDRNGNIWIATQGGLSKYGKVIFHIYNQGLIKDDINILAITEKDGRVFLGTYEGLNILEADNRITQYVPHIESIRGTDIFSILATEKNVWLGLYDGIIDYTNAHGTFLPFSYKFTRNMSPWTTDLKSVGGKLYCATDLGLVLYENHEFSYYTHSDGLPTDEIWKLDIDTSGYIWCATASGLSIFDGKSFHNFGIKDGMSDNLCQDIAFDQNGIAFRKSAC